VVVTRNAQVHPESLTAAGLAPAAETVVEPLPAQRDLPG